MVWSAWPFGAAALALTAGAGPALAQAPASAPATAPPAAASPPDAAEASSRGEIIVTANRRAERLQDVPLSVTAIGGDVARERGIDTPEDLGRLAPSLINQNNASDPVGTNFSIRGVGTASFQRSVEPSVAVVVDDVSLVRSELAQINFVDLAQVEVLDGPQGFLFGKNASAGLVNVRTNDPVLGQTSGRLFAEFGHLDNSSGTDLGHAQLVLNTPLGQDAAARVNVYTVRDSALADNVSPDPRFDGGLRQLGASGKVLWKPTEQLSLLFAADYLDSQGAGGGIATIRQDSGTPLTPTLAAYGVTPGVDNDKSAYNAPTYYALRLGGAQVKATYALGGGFVLTDILAGRVFQANQRFDADYSPLPLVQTFGGGLSIYQVSNELRLTSPVGPRLDYQVGVYVLRARVNENDVLAANLGMAPPTGFTTVLGGNNFQRELIGNYAVYGQGTYRILRRLRFQFGARVTHDDLDQRFQTTLGGGVTGLYPAAGPASDSHSTTNFSWRTTLQYDLAQDWMIYGTAAQGYKGPGYAQFSLNYVRPEIPTHFEVGSKAEFFDRRVTANVAFFNTDFKDFQAQSVDAQMLTFLLQNAGELRTRGVEGQLAWRPISHLSLSAGATYTDARFLSFNGDACYRGQPDCVNGVTNSSGRRLPNAPEFKGVFAATYDQPIGADYLLTYDAGLLSQTGYNFQSNGDPNSYQRGYTTLDLAVALHDTRRGWTLRAFCRNVTDARFVSTVQEYPLFAAHIQNLSYNGFRQLGASLDVRF